MTVGSIRVCVVDDDRDFATSLGYLLRARGYEAELAFSGEDALQRCQNEKFDFVLLDFKLTGMDGVQCLSELRKIDPNVKGAIMSAFDVERMDTDLRSLGDVNVLRKPFRIDAVVEVIEAHAPRALVLIADDDPDFVLSLTQLLERGRYKVAVAMTGEDALENTARQPVDVLILDLRLPILSGAEVFRRLAADGRAPPTIVVTGFAEDEAEVIAELRSLDVRECLVKPVSSHVLFEALEAVLRPQ